MVRFAEDDTYGDQDVAYGDQDWTAGAYDDAAYAQAADAYAPADDAWNTPYALYGSGRIEDPFFGVNLSGASDLELYLLLLGNARI